LSEAHPFDDLLTEPPLRDRKQEREFRATRPAKDLCCVVPGCPKKFRPSTSYKDVLIHWKAAHGLKETR